MIINNIVQIKFKALVLTIRSDNRIPRVLLVLIYESYIINRNIHKEITINKRKRIYLKICLYVLFLIINPITHIYMKKMYYEKFAKHTAYNFNYLLYLNYIFT